MPKTRPAYAEEFRRDAVELLVTSGRSLKEVADELGVTTFLPPLFIAPADPAVAVAQTPRCRP